MTEGFVGLASTGGSRNFASCANRFIPPSARDLPEGRWRIGVPHLRTTVSQSVKPEPDAAPMQRQRTGRSSLVHRRLCCSFSATEKFANLETISRDMIQRTLCGEGSRPP